MSLLTIPPALCATSLAEGGRGFRACGRGGMQFYGGGNFRWASGEKCAILFLFHGREGALCLFAPIYIR